MAKKKPVSAMYPTPEKVSLKQPLKITSVDSESRTFELQATDEADAEAIKNLADVERARFDMIERLRRYKLALLGRLEHVLGDATSVPWAEISQRIHGLKIPEDASAEIRDSILALQTLAVLNQALIEQREITPAIKIAICMAIDFGQLLQRSQTQIDFGQIVGDGIRNRQDLKKATGKKTTNRNDRSNVAFQEFYLSMAPEIVAAGLAEKCRLQEMPRSEFMGLADQTRKASSILKRMANTQKFGSRRTLDTFRQTWATESLK